MEGEPDYEEGEEEDEIEHDVCVDPEAGYLSFAMFVPGSGAWQTGGTAIFI